MKFSRSILFASIYLFILTNNVIGQQLKQCFQSPFQSIKEIYTVDSILSSNNYKLNLDNRTIIYVPIVFHVVWKYEKHNVNESILKSQLEVLNSAFNADNSDIVEVPAEFKKDIGKMNIQFCLAAIDPSGNACSGINRIHTNIDMIGLSDHLYSTFTGGADAWDTDHFLNIWVADTGKAFSGFGTYPGAVERDKIGVVIHPEFIGINNKLHYGLGRTLVHELGHYFGLKHLWGDDEDCQSDDEVADTPLQFEEHFKCPLYPQNGCSSSEMFMNYMDYVDDDCMVFFTQGQVNRMMEVIHLFRPTIVNSKTTCIEYEYTESRPYPNPSDGLFYIEINNDDMDTELIHLYNVDGIRLDAPIEKVNSNIMINLTNNVEGIYFLKVKDKMYKLIKM